MIWDIYPTIIYISVEDTQGNSLLDPKVEGNILENGIKIIYQGKTYEKDSLYDGLSRAYLARFYGIRRKRARISREVRLYKVIILTDSKWKSAFVGKICAEIGVCR